MAVPLPTGLTAREAMILGTAGLTAALSVRALQGAGVRPESGPVLVTGASGGVGHAAITILARLGYEVAASTGKADMHARLRQLGATHLLSREELILEPAKPLDKQRWAGVIDTTGGLTLSRVLGAVRYGGAVAASGMAGGSSLQMSVYPFILRGVSLLGIDSVYATMDLRRELWSKLAGDWKPHDVESIAAAEIGLAEIPGAAAALLAGEARGRFVVRVQA